MTEGSDRQAVEPTPLLSGIPFVTGRYQTLTEALDYAATGATGFNFHNVMKFAELTIP